MPRAESERAKAQREYRATPHGKAVTAAHRRRTRARIDAMRELTLMYPDDYRRILIKHMKAIPDAQR